MSRSIARRTLAVVAAVLVALAALPALALASAPDELYPQVEPASGTWGTCAWEIDADGVLTINPGEGAATEGTCPWATHAASVRGVVLKSSEETRVVLPEDSSNLFAGLNSASYFDLSGADTSNATNMDGMFSSCPGVTGILDLSMFNTSSVTSMKKMFSGLSSVTGITFSSTFSTAKVTTMEGMFQNCNLLESLDLSGFNTHKVESMDSMFNGCRALSKLDLTVFDTVSVTNMSWMFNSSSVVSLDLSSFNTANVQSMQGMFDKCSKLQSVKLGQSFRFLADKSCYLPTIAINSHTDWFSTADKIWCTSATIATTRNGRADTYTKTGAGIEMFRLYNPNSGEHFYTADTNERDTLVELGWNYEGVGWMAPKSSSAPVYRLYNANAGEHHYTPAANEMASLVEAGWTYEGIGWYSDDAKTTPLYRDYNPNAYANNHNYTTDLNEHTTLVGLGWRAEGIAWYGV